MRRRVDELGVAVAAGETQLDADVAALDGLQQDVRTADEPCRRSAARTDEHDVLVKEARGALEAIRAVVAELDIALATAEAICRTSRLPASMPCRRRSTK